MSGQAIAILHSGLVTSVGLSAPASCAAIRAAVTNHDATRFVDSEGEWIVGARVALEKPWRGRAKLLKMLAIAVAECLEPLEKIAPQSLPLLLCVAERERPGRIGGLDDALFRELEQETGVTFHPDLSAIVPDGRASVGLALAQARKLIHERQAPYVLIGAADTLLVGRTLADCESRQRLLTSRNSNGFVPGEAAGAILISRPSDAERQLRCYGVGYASERVTVETQEPFRADGLTQAIRAALAEAGCEMRDLDFRITDSSGEQYYFKEAALALSRTLRVRKERFDIWHPADCIGEVGAAIGAAMLAVALAGCRKAYAAGNNILWHLGNDAGHRAAAVLRFEGPV